MTRAYEYCRRRFLSSFRIHPRAKLSYSFPRLRGKSRLRLTRQSLRYGQEYERIASEALKFCRHSVIKGPEAKILQKTSYLLGGKAKNLEYAKLRWRAGQEFNLQDGTGSNEASVILLLLQKALENH